ncbi:MAG: hypothetical protein JXC32_19275 [Anaerolineae bacterium]|nr:hypothetical protein [Anaerolineae bacterium]
MSTESLGPKQAVTVHAYGKLAEGLSDRAGSLVKAVGRRQKVVRVPLRPGYRLTSLLQELDIQRADLYSVFLNGRLLATRNAMAPWLRYQQAQDDVWNWDHDVELNHGDRVGLFGEDMALLVV